MGSGKRRVSQVSNMLVSLTFDFVNAYSSLLVTLAYGIYMFRLKLVLWLTFWSVIFCKTVDQNTSKYRVWCVFIESSHKKLNLHYKLQVSLSNRDAVYVNIKQKEKEKNKRSIKSYFSISGWQELFKSHNIQFVANVFYCCCYC